MPLVLLNKPFKVLCQFTDPDGRAVLADYVNEAGVYPAGRLDYDSEGLVALTDDGALQARISQPRSAKITSARTPSGKRVQIRVGRDEIARHHPMKRPSRPPPRTRDFVSPFSRSHSKPLRWGTATPSRGKPPSRSRVASTPVSIISSSPRHRAWARPTWHVPPPSKRGES